MANVTPDIDINEVSMTTLNDSLLLMTKKVLHPHSPPAGSSASWFGCSRCNAPLPLTFLLRVHPPQNFFSFCLPVVGAGLVPCYVTPNFPRPPNFLILKRFILRKQNLHEIGWKKIQPRNYHQIIQRFREN